ncbi:MAG: hypothetical protein DWQ31_16690 [Planctomycetota bacterium]|nr:MAG: hypothetical protein DWQ31_16690 [Planctomycetota bacterium]
MKQLALLLLAIVATHHPPLATRADEAPPEILIRIPDGHPDPGNQLLTPERGWRELLTVREPDADWQARYPGKRSAADLIYEHGGVYLHNPWWRQVPMQFHQFTQLCDYCRAHPDDLVARQTCDVEAFVAACSQLRRDGIWVTIYIGGGGRTTTRLEGETESEFTSRMYAELWPYLAIHPPINELVFDAEYDGVFSQLIERLKFHNRIQVGIEPTATYAAAPHYRRVNTHFMETWHAGNTRKNWAGKWLDPAAIRGYKFSILRLGYAEADASKWATIADVLTRHDSAVVAVLEAPQTGSLEVAE